MGRLAIRPEVPAILNLAFPERMRTGRSRTRHSLADRRLAKNGSQSPHRRHPATNLVFPIFTSPSTAGEICKNPRVISCLARHLQLPNSCRPTGIGFAAIRYKTKGGAHNEIQFGSRRYVRCGLRSVHFVGGLRGGGPHGAGCGYGNRCIPYLGGHCLQDFQRLASEGEVGGADSNGAYACKSGEDDT